MRFLAVRAGEADSPTNPQDFRLPDFTVSYEVDTWYWEHLGMLLGNQSLARSVLLTYDERRQS
jgi:hypothetical protein